MSASPSDGIIGAFMKSYTREYDFFPEAARICQRQCEWLLENNGIRAIITSRVKRPDRLLTKLHRRKNERNYSCSKDIYDDIVNLAGVRIALYFPSDREKVDALLNQHFTHLRVAKDFPDHDKTRPD